MAVNGGGGMGSFYANMPEEVTLTVNGNHPIFQNILKKKIKKSRKIKLEISMHVWKPVVCGWSP